VAISLAKIAAVSCVALTNVVLRPLPFHCTVEPLTKFVPVTVRANAAAPAVALEGESEAIAGAGFTVSVAVVETPL